MITTLETLEQLRCGSSGIIYFSRYRADQVDNGGARRVAQVLQLLEGYELEFVTSLVRPKSAGKRNSSGAVSLLSMAVQAVIRGSYRKYSPEFANWIFFSRRLARRWTRALCNRNNIRLIIVDDPIFFAPLVQALHNRNIPILAHCHNIETLSRSQVQQSHQVQLLGEELELLRLCRAAITISREETFLLRNLGMKPVYLSYYPPKSVEWRLRTVREIRTGMAKRDFLLLGSAGNAPTRKGMQQIINMWGKICPCPGDDRLVVAGFGTENLDSGNCAAGLIFVGAVTDAELDGILTTARAAIVYQEDGAGALTRIAELLLAGVPVLANSHAARSYQHLPGVFEFAELADMPLKLEEVRKYNEQVGPPAFPDDAAVLHVIDSLKC